MHLRMYISRNARIRQAYTATSALSALAFSARYRLPKWIRALYRVRNGSMTGILAITVLLSRAAYLI